MELRIVLHGQKMPLHLKEGFRQNKYFYFIAPNEK